MLQSVKDFVTVGPPETRRRERERVAFHGPARLMRVAELGLNLVQAGAEPGDHGAEVGEAYRLPCSYS